MLPSLLGGTVSPRRPQPKIQPTKNKQIPKAGETC